MRRVIFPLLVLSLGLAGAVSADPVTLTAGSAFVGGAQSSAFEEGSFDLSGSGFSAAGAGVGSAPSYVTFKVGLLNLSGDFDLSPAGTQYFGFVTTGGQTLRGFASAAFHVTAVPFVVSDAPQGTWVNLNTPFSARGLVQLFAHFGDAQPIFSQQVTGSGTMWIGGSSIGERQYITGGVGLTFSPAESASPTPEPASMLLLGTGLVAAWRSRRLRVS